MSDMKTKIRKVWYRWKHDFFTVRNVVTVIAFVLCVSWAWSSISTMHRNYNLQRKVDDRRRESLVLELETLALEYETNYYKTKEYQELAAREKLGLAKRGEKLLVLPENSDEAVRKYDAKVVEVESDQGDNFYQWMRFLFGTNHSNM
jgi:Septum formation initiator.